ncbi:hypothetical protein SAMN04489835_2277 [Mycolicibacterium rutilum]|uniref:Uncharacterized protein n=1 Tax=Mycolicibacterium rutilum TaxID=370526 RepID=A0A1H6JVL7_MYCRU|nr:hypothetical protein [Mycolicibacterium rutilum]SEH63358.1 hypothetical protein SAMN04489835_2277 [Mycolicibacterium rutilum]
MALEAEECLFCLAEQSKRPAERTFQIPGRQAGPVPVCLEHFDQLSAWSASASD